MRLFNSAAFFLAVIHFGEALDQNAKFDPYVPGELTVNYTRFNGLLTLFLDTNLDVYAPNAAGSFPVLYFMTGLGGIIDGSAYSKFLSQVASHGFVAVTVWKVESPINSFDPAWMDEAVRFVETRLERNLINNHGYDPGFTIDYHNSFIGGHSSGAHVPVAQLLAHCLNFRGQILLSPVDGADPLGYLPYAVITPGEKVNFTIPTLQIVVGLDEVKSPFGTACAPPELSGYRFFDAMNGPTWLVNATAFGHTDILDDEYEELVELTQFCYASPDPPKEPYRKFIAGSFVSFMRAITDPLNSCYLLDNLETSGNAGVETTVDFSSNGWQRCEPTQCIHN